jgi:hypothetical protein
MNVSTEQAVEIHAKALHYRGKCVAIDMARKYADRCKKAGDLEGRKVWQSVEEHVRQLAARET